MTRIEKAKELYPYIESVEIIKMLCPIDLLDGYSCNCFDLVTADVDVDMACTKCWNMEV